MSLAKVQINVAEIPYQNEIIPLGKKVNGLSVTNFLF